MGTWQEDFEKQMGETGGIGLEGHVADDAGADLEKDPLTAKVIGAAIEVHKALGPGLLESVYEECLCYELSKAGLSFKRQSPVPIRYKEARLDCGFRMDLTIEDQVVIEIKAVEKLMPIHEAQLLTYLRLSGLHKGLLLNFNSVPLIKGIRRFVL